MCNTHPLLPVLVLGSVPLRLVVCGACHTSSVLDLHTVLAAFACVLAWIVLGRGRFTGHDEKLMSQQPSLGLIGR